MALGEADGVFRSAELHYAVLAQRIKEEFDQGIVVEDLAFGNENDRMSRFVRKFFYIPLQSFPDPEMSLRNQSSLICRSYKIIPSMSLLTIFRRSSVKL